MTLIGSPGLSIAVQLNAAARRDEVRASVLRGNPRVDRVFEIAGLGDLPVFVDAPV